MRKAFGHTRLFAFKATSKSVMRVNRQNGYNLLIAANTKQLNRWQIPMYSKSRCFSALLSLLLSMAGLLSISIAEQVVKETATFNAPEAVQGVAVDDEHFYAITNQAIGKYDLKTGKQVAQWKSTPELPLTHLNSGVVIKDRLYSAHSNWPRLPRKNSIEIWDTTNLEHVASHHFKDADGALNWIDQSDGDWYGVFAHYSHGEDLTNPAHVSHTRLVQLDQKWEAVKTWNFPTKVWRRFAPASNSGGCFADDGTLYCTGHDHAELYRLKIPKSGSTLEYLETVSAPITGQGIAWQRSEPALLFGIRRSKREVVQMKMTEARGSSTK